MANLNVSDQELQAILGELENDLGAYLTATKDKLSKAREEDGTPSPGMGSASASPSSASGSPSASSPAAEGAPAGAPPASASEGGVPAEAAPAEGAPPSEGLAPEGAPAEAAPSPGAEAGVEAPIDPAALEAEYAKLPPEELKAHYLACKAALFAVMGGGEGASPEAGAPPPAAAPSPAAPAPSPAAPPMAMSEMGTEVGKDLQAGNGGEGAPTPKPEAAAKAEVSPSASASVTKSEKDELEALKAQLDTMFKFVNKIVGKPLQKAVTSAEYVAPAGEKADLDPKAVTSKLNELTRKPDLKKSDRDLINRFYDGEVKIDAIEHLLK